MADLIFGVVGLALAAPNIASGVKKWAEGILKLIARIKEGSATLRSLQTLVENLYDGKLNVYTNILDHTLQGNSLDPCLRASLEHQILMLQNLLTSIHTKLGKLVDDTKTSRRIRFIIYGDRDLKRDMQDFREWEAQFTALILLVTRPDGSVSREPHLLTASKFRTIELYDRTPIKVHDASYIRLTSAEIKDIEPRQIPVLIEETAGNAHESAADLKLSISELAGYLVRGVTNGGLLKCLGYRDNLELVFELPEDLERPRTLSDIIRSTATDVHGGGYALDARFRLAYHISEAVLNVHLCHFVHKNIRTETIVVFQRRAPGIDALKDSTIGVPYLTNWSMLRKTDHNSSRSGDDDWVKNIYRHPERQGQHPQQRYNMGHDIYSLGVCLLEIGLWSPLVVLEEGEPKLCTLYRDTAAKLEALTAEDLDSMEALTRPAIVQHTLMRLAQWQLPKRVGATYAKVVVECLQFLGPAALLEVSSKDSTLIAVKYIESVLLSLGKLKNWETTL